MGTTLRGTQQFLPENRAAKPSADAVCGDGSGARTPLKCEEKVIDDRRQLVGSYSLSAALVCEWILDCCHSITHTHTQLPSSARARQSGESNRRLDLCAHKMKNHFT